VQHPLAQFIAAAHHGGEPEPALVEEHDALKPALVQHVVLAVRAGIQQDKRHLDAVKLPEPGGDLGGHHAAEAVAVEVELVQLVGPGVLHHRDHDFVDVEAHIGVSDGGEPAALVQRPAQRVQDPQGFLPARLVARKEEPAGVGKVLFCGLVRNREDLVDAAFGLHPPREQHVGCQHGGGTRTNQEAPPRESREFGGVPKHAGVGVAGPAHILNSRLMRHISTVATGTGGSETTPDNSSATVRRLTPPTRVRVRGPLHGG
jgi:hypothetical protein